MSYRIDMLPYRPAGDYQVPVGMGTVQDFGKGQPNMQRFHTAPIPKGMALVLSLYRLEKRAYVVTKERCNP